VSLASTISSRSARKVSMTMPVIDSVKLRRNNHSRSVRASRARARWVTASVSGSATSVVARM